MTNEKRVPQKPVPPPPAPPPPPPPPDASPLINVPKPSELEKFLEVIARNVGNARMRIQDPRNRESMAILEHELKRELANLRKAREESSK